MSSENNYVNSLISLKLQVKTYIKKHSEYSKNYKYIYNIIMYSSIVLGITISFVITSFQNDSPGAIRYSVAALSFLNSILISIIKFKNFEEISLTHKKATKEYLGLYKSISNQLLTKSEDNGSFTLWAFKKYDLIFESTPFVINKDMFEEEQNVSSTSLPNITPDLPQSDIMQYELRRLQSVIQV